jgi:hypothetical protein
MKGATTSALGDTDVNTIPPIQDCFELMLHLHKLIENVKLQHRIEGI